RAGRAGVQEGQPFQQQAGEAVSLAGRVAVVTGAAGLLGREHCAALSVAGATVVATDLVADGLDADLAVAADITKPGDLERLRDAILGRYDRLDVLVNNAALNDKVEGPAAALELSRFEKYPLALWQRALDVNVTGSFLACHVL